MDAVDQKALDTALIALDGTPNKEKLGANAILSVSLASAVAAAAEQRIAPYRHINALFSSLVATKLVKIPTPTVNVINGGKHGAGNLDFQEFHVVPASSLAYHDALRLAVEVYHAINFILTQRNAIHSIGDEGGYAPNLFTNLDALEVITDAIKTTSYKLGLDAFLGLDIAASHFKSERGYQIKDKPMALSTNQFIDYLKELQKKYHLLILEDALDEDDWEGWREITAAFGKDTLIVGDDLLATNPGRLKKAIDQKACSAILAKPNQIGTLSEFLGVIALARQNGMQIIVSHRSGETNDSLIADIGVAVQADYVKFGAPARGERVAKYNRLLQIESELLAK
jgi:enolase